MPEMPQEISKLFRVPRRARPDNAKYRSPLLFDDGRKVQSVADWNKRRREILACWLGVMGPWPKLLAKPRLDLLSSRRRPGMTIHKALIEVAPDWPMMRCYLLVPDGARRCPAVLGLFYEPETLAGLGGRPGRDFCLQLARHGFVTMAIGCEASQLYYPSIRNAMLQPLSFAAYMAANCHTALAGLAEVDPARIGVVGHSYGGKWAMFASCLYDKFACAAWSDPGIVFDETMRGVNYWDRWYLGYEKHNLRPPWTPPGRRHPRTGAYRKLVDAGHDLHELHALMAPRPFLVSGGCCDPLSRWRALAHAVEVNRLLGFDKRVAMTSRRGHSPTPESNRNLALFFEHCLMRRGD